MRERLRHYLGVLLDWRKAYTELDNPYNSGRFGHNSLSSWADEHGKRVGESTIRIDDVIKGANLRLRAANDASPDVLLVDSFTFKLPRPNPSPEYHRDVTDITSTVISSLETHYPCESHFDILGIQRVTSLLNDLKNFEQLNPVLLPAFHRDAVPLLEDHASWIRKSKRDRPGAARIASVMEIREKEIAKYFEPAAGMAKYINSSSHPSVVFAECPMNSMLSASLPSYAIVSPVLHGGRNK
jgi:hypothetical protein